MIDCFGAGYDALERMELLPLVRRKAFTLTESCGRWATRTLSPLWTSGC